MATQWEVVIGLETHAQLSTVSKIFSGASTQFGAEPNTQACPVDLALPGVLPVLNRGAVERAIKASRFKGAAGQVTAPPVLNMLWVSLATALIIAIGKISPEFWALDLFN